MTKKRDLWQKVEDLCEKTLDQLAGKSDNGGLELTNLKELKVVTDCLKTVQISKFYAEKAAQDGADLDTLSSQSLINALKPTDSD